MTAASRATRRRSCAKARSSTRTARRSSNYKSYLESRHDAVLGSVGGGKKLYSYGYVVQRLRRRTDRSAGGKTARRCAACSASKKTTPCSSTPRSPRHFLASPGRRASGQTTGAKGENVIIGIVDGGAWPEHPSFSDRTGVNGNATKDGKLGYQQIPGWHGKCVPGEQFTAQQLQPEADRRALLQRRLGRQRGHRRAVALGIQLAARLTAATAPTRPRRPAAMPTSGDRRSGGIWQDQRYCAARAHRGVQGLLADRRPAAAASPRTALQPSTRPSRTASMSSTSRSAVRTTNFRDSVEIAFLFAADAGVFVAASAGNSGPTTSTVAHPGPWLTTVAAGTHNRNGVGSVTLGNGVTYNGRIRRKGGEPLATRSTRRLRALPGADATTVALCFARAMDDTVPHATPCSIPPRSQARSSSASAASTRASTRACAVKEAGGAGMVLLNTP